MLKSHDSNWWQGKGKENTGYLWQEESKLWQSAAFKWTNYLCKRSNEGETGYKRISTGHTRICNDTGNGGTREKGGNVFLLGDGATIAYWLAYETKGTRIMNELCAQKKKISSFMNCIYKQRDNHILLVVRTVVPQQKKYIVSSALCEFV